VRLLTRQDGSVAERYDYNPFGKALSDDKPAKNGDQPRGFAGKERDDATGFDYFGGRYLLSDASRFTTVDTVLDMDSALTDPQRWSRYAYVRNNPLRYVDPDGKCIWDACAGEIALYVGVSYAAVVIAEAAVATAIVLSPVGRKITDGMANTVTAALEGARELAAGLSTASDVPYDLTPENEQRIRMGRPPIGHDGIPLSYIIQSNCPKPQRSK
jgi:RHS repeat-associated protein